MAATITVEDGTQVTGANSYVTTAELSTYADERGVTISAAEQEDLLIEAMDYIESQSFKGYKLTETQALQWPRGDVLVDGYYIDTDEIPTLLKEAQMESALAIDAGNSPIANIERKKDRVVVGEIEVEYSSSSSSQVILQKVDLKLRKLIKNGGGSSFSVIRA